MAIHGTSAKHVFVLTPSGSCQMEHVRLASMDSDLEAFSRNPTDGSFAVLAFQLAAFTKYMNEVFLSY